MIDISKSVPGCMLGKRRAGQGGDIYSLCMEQCKGCGWNSDEYRQRLYAIQHGGMTLSPYGLETLYVIGNEHKRYVAKDEDEG